MFPGKPGDRVGGEDEVHRACAGANAAIDELLALTEDFKQEVSWSGRGLLVGLGLPRGLSWNLSVSTFRRHLEWLEPSLCRL